MFRVEPQVDLRAGLLVTEALVRVAKAQKEMFDKFDDTAELEEPRERVDQVLNDSSRYTEALECRVRDLLVDRAVRRAKL
jgi:hypothetical protein